MLLYFAVPRSARLGAMFFRRSKKSVERPVVEDEGEHYVNLALSTLDAGIHETREARQKVIRVRSTAERVMTWDSSSAS